MQAGLGNEHRPFGMPLANLTQHLEHRVLTDIGRFHHPEQQMGLRLAVANVLARIVGDFAQATGIEKAHHRRFGGKIVETGGTGARLETVADFGASLPVRARTIEVLPAWVLPISHSTGNGCRARASRKAASNFASSSTRMQQGSAQAAPVVGPVRVQCHSPNLSVNQPLRSSHEVFKCRHPGHGVQSADKKTPPLSCKEGAGSSVPERDRGWLPPLLATVVAWGRRRVVIVVLLPEAVARRTAPAIAIDHPLAAQRIAPSVLQEILERTAVATARTPPAATATIRSRRSRCPVPPALQARRRWARTSPATRAGRCNPDPPEPTAAACRAHALETPPPRSRPSPNNRPRRRSRNRRRR
jgi:hypothetical protein